MKVKIEKYILQEEMVDMDFPIYFKHDFQLDNTENILYGKVELSSINKDGSCRVDVYTIDKDEPLSDRSSITYKFSVERSELLTSYMSYLTNPNNTSNKEEFESIKKESLTFTQTIF